MNILIVDDEKLIVDDLTHEVRALLPGRSLRIDGTTSAVDAVQMAEQTEYDVALLDIDMPDMDGLNLARRLIAACPAVNIIFVTGYKDYAIEALDLYCSAYLVKPVGARKLKKAFENLRRPFLDLPPSFSEEHYSGEAVIGRRIRMFREQRAISTQALADLMKVSRQTVYRWEQGERMPDILTLLKLARILGVRVDALLGLPSEPGRGRE